MKKSDLETGMCIEMRDGEKFLVVESDETVFLVRNDNWDDLFEYNDDLTHADIEDCDIVKVWKTNIKALNYMFDNSDRGILWEREEEEEKIDWTKIPVDSKLLITENGFDFPRYYAGIKDGEPSFWTNGTTSYTVTTCRYSGYEKFNPKNAKIVK